MEEFLQSTYMDPLTDYGFKKLFGEVSNKELLIDFLNEVIKEEGCITDIKYQQTEQLGNTEDDRKAVFDIFCKNDKDEWIIVEMQKAKQAHFVDRSLFYSSFPIQRQAPKGKTWNFELKAVYTVALLNFRLFNEPGDEDYFIEKIYLARERTKTRYSKKLNFIFVELPKFKKTIEKLETNADRWLYCFKYLGQMEERPEELSGGVFDRLFEKAEINKLTNTEMEEYRKSILEYADVRDCMDCARAEGRTEGWTEGRTEGMEEGQISKSFEVAKKCFQEGLPAELIVKLTGLTSEQILQIQPQNG